MLSNLKTRWLAITIIFDLILTALALWLAYFIRQIFPAGVYLDETFSFAVLDEPLLSPIVFTPVVLLTWLIVFSNLSVYNINFEISYYDQIHPLIEAVTGAVLVLAGLAYFLFPDLSRFLFLYFYILDLIFLISWRKLIVRCLNREQFQTWRPQHRILVVGQGELADNVVQAIDRMAWAGVSLAGLVDDEFDSLGKLDKMTDLVNDLKIDEVIFALPPSYQDILRDIVFKLHPLPVNIRLLPDVINLVFVQANIEDFAGLPLIGLREPAINVFDRLVKRTFDIAFALLLLITTSPLFLVITFINQLDSRLKGQIFYTSQRVGEGGKSFCMYKFRTMVDGANQTESDLLVEAGSELRFNKSPDDPRVTQLGRILRRTSLDELPQLLNVLKGDMSLVGPRPELPWLVEHYEVWQYQRFTVPQGMTGWWQVKHRGDQKHYNVRLEDDLYYIHNYSFFLDLRILWLTMGAIIRGDGAY